MHDSCNHLQSFITFIVSNDVLFTDERVYRVDGAFPGEYDEIVVREACYVPDAVVGNNSLNNLPKLPQRRLQSETVSNQQNIRRNKNK